VKDGRSLELGTFKDMSQSPAIWRPAAFFFWKIRGASVLFSHTSKSYFCTVDLTKICTFSTTIFIIPDVSFFFFQTVEQQSAASHSRHAVWQHAQPSPPVSTLFNTYQSSNFCQYVYCIIDPLNFVFWMTSQMTVFLSAGGAEVFCFGFLENTSAYFSQIWRVICVNL
jgi:hypothetical protein